ncbi:hypothetical protein ASPWEDRAFT_38060 [Aspergillus wentii DTO 134E9]|uniref:Uncharacterized protein n=1 Tax=Aspergillus wentii DTO 134E9 TaxID=1073089 RepID=A0A1L9RNN8_ASPWE|nr:uncharacterized protein ASPWEDRAFT_38060 [Aspergillus wentii DTO 134E9]OJJ36483.1 hypothetical protein ASPWEDRAFT_38060 [Aspergillus wentii DTO 134E9]
MVTTILRNTCSQQAANQGLVVVWRCDGLPHFMIPSSCRSIKLLYRAWIRACYMPSDTVPPSVRLPSDPRSLCQFLHFPNAWWMIFLEHDVIENSVRQSRHFHHRTERDSVSLSWPYSCSRENVTPPSAQPPRTRIIAYSGMVRDNPRREER